MGEFLSVGDNLSDLAAVGLSLGSGPIANFSVSCPILQYLSLPEGTGTIAVKSQGPRPALLTSGIPSKRCAESGCLYSGC
jgi:hypothetical protein